MQVVAALRSTCNGLHAVLQGLVQASETRTARQLPILCCSGVCYTFAAGLVLTRHYHKALMTWQRVRKLTLYIAPMCGLSLSANRQMLS